MSTSLRMLLLAGGLLSLPVSATADEVAVDHGEYQRSILPMRQRVQVMEDWWKRKEQVVLPQIMREQSVDMWIVRNDEADKYYNNEGPVYTSLLPANYEGMTTPSQYASPGSQQVPRFMLFHDNGSNVDYIEPSSYKHISEMVADLEPSRIAIGEHNNAAMLEALGEKFSMRTVDSWTLGVRWLETMVPEQVTAYRDVQGVANELIAEGFSNAAIIPGVTTTDDLNWWFRQRMLDLDIEYENHPSIRVQRRPAYIDKFPDDAAEFVNGRVGNGSNVTIQRGDIISIDSDVFMLGMVTDSHQHVYVLDAGEQDIPDELQSALETVNEVQDQYAKEFVIGRTGREIVASSDDIKRPARVVESELAFHPPPMFLRRYLLGGYMFSHKTYVAGMTSGPGYYPTSIVSNDHKLYANTLYAFEPHTWVAVRGWGDHGVELGMGQIVVVDDAGLQYLNRSQKSKWHVVR
ncbi:MAG: M24 family metallopeptidase [Woeseia sp.]|jgi:hypothetical protein|nr:M24 family metallopeptidase [Woeseia sp.]MBT6208876.1 M24 family metallopeptidase [Woeseia sp.]